MGRQYEALFGKVAPLKEVQEKLLGNAAPAAVSSPASPTAKKSQFQRHGAATEPDVKQILERQAGKLIANMESKTKLLALVDNCYNAMSYQSRTGEKGELVKILREKVSNLDVKTMDIDDTQAMVKHLISITARYRETYFFQASYGEKRSAKALIAAVRDPEINKARGLSALVLHDSKADVAKLRDEVIVGGLNELR
jgi:hypothetical protein